MRVPWRYRFLLILLLAHSPNAFAELEFRDAWIKNLPVSVPVRAGYMTIHNPRTEVTRIIAVRSDAFASIEIHQTVDQEGLMRMEQLSGLSIEPGATVELSPGGLHLMMINPAAATRPGEMIKITFILDDGSEQNLEMQVKP